MRRMMVVLAAMVAMGVLPSAAFAWSGSSWTKNTCGADLSTPAEGSGSWWVQVSDESGVLYTGSLSAVKAHPFTTIGGWSNDTGFHVVTYSVANAADHKDGLVTYSQEQMNCSAKVGPAGPTGAKGDKGDPGKDGVGYDCAAHAVTGGATPATCPGQSGSNGTNGSNGKDGSSISTTILIQSKSRVCVSRRVYTFMVRKRYRGQILTNVTAKEPGTKVTVRRVKSGKSKGRYVVSVDFRGMKVGDFDHGRHIEVSAKVGKFGKLVFNEDVDLCRAADGAQNAPSASGDARPA